MENHEKLSPHSENKDEIFWKLSIPLEKLWLDAGDIVAGNQKADEKKSEKLSRHLEKEDDALWEDRLKWREKSLDKEELTWEEAA